MKRGRPSESQDPVAAGLEGWCAGADSLAARLVREGVAPHVAAGYFRSSERAYVPARGSGDVDAFFDLASLTKPMTALAFERAGLSREAPLGSFLPELRATRSADVRLELLFAHRAGLPPHLSLYAPLLEGKPVDVQAALVAAADARCEAAPEHGAEGHSPAYSDVGYILAGEALARATGARDAGEAISELVAKPLGLGASLGTARALRASAPDFHARVVPTEVVAFRGGEVRGVVHDENAWALTGDGGSGHAGMFGTLGAVLAFARAALGACFPGAADDPLGLAGRATWLVAPRPGGTLRAGFDGKSSDGSSIGTILGPRTFGHLGFTGTSFWIDPEARIGVALLTNRVHPTRENAALRGARPEAHDTLATLALARDLP